MLSFLYGPTLTSIHDYWKNHSFMNHRVHKVVCGPFLLSSSLSFLCPFSLLSIADHPRSPLYVLGSLGDTVIWKSSCPQVPDHEIQSTIFFLIYITNCLYSIEAKAKEVNRRDENYKKNLLSSYWLQALLDVYMYL